MKWKPESLTASRREQTLINNRQAERSRVMEALSFHSSYLPKEACLFYMAQKEARYIMVIGTSCFSCLSKVCQSDGEITTMDDGSGPVPALAWMSMGRNKHEKTFWSLVVWEPFCVRQQELLLLGLAQKDREKQKQKVRPPKWVSACTRFVEETSLFLAWKFLFSADHPSSDAWGANEEKSKQLFYSNCIQQPLGEKFA